MWTRRALLPTQVAGVEPLLELALDLRWSWHHSGEELWAQLDPELWALTHNPWVVLQTVSRTTLEARLADPAFRRRVEALLEAHRRRAEAPAWFAGAHPEAPLTTVAYFSLEFGLSEALPIYSGGLGNVAGDQLKAASDLGVPVVGVGLLYQQGYFRQVIDAQGAQRALHPYNDPGQLPVTPVRTPDGEWLRVEFALPGYKVWLRAWQVQVGRVTLFLLDSNDPANIPAHRGVTSELYGGGPETRLTQEMVLGLGGWRLLERLGVRAEVCHLNEGHAAFAVLERARSYMQETGHAFDVALAATRAGNVFTTHTPVEAGFDRFRPELMAQYFGRYAPVELGITLRELLALGRRHPDDDGEPFTMAYLAVRGSGAVNGVSRLHGQVSRRIFGGLFPRWPEAEVPVSHVTNGVHMPSWDSPEADALWTAACGEDRWLDRAERVEQAIRGVPEGALWGLRATARRALIAYVRRRLSRQLAAAGAPAADVVRARHVLDPNALTLGFARRFATYKRPNLLLHEPARLLRLLTSRERPVQLIIAGKAHPADHEGQAMVQAWMRFIARPEARARVVFLADYDLLLAAQLVQGVDVWINNPRRPWEASGTSGMKVLVNGGLNLSQLDGWWAEAYSPAVGWAIGDGREHEPASDAADADALYTLLEQQVVPGFYERNDAGVPAAWVARMRESMACLAPRFSATRTVREYTERYYVPAARAYARRVADKGALAAQLVDWRRGLDDTWGSIHFGDLRVEATGDEHVVHVHVYLNDMSPEAVRVELYADGAGEWAPIRLDMVRGAPLVGATNGYVYTARVPGPRPAADYTPRVVPHHPEAAVPLEAGHVLWRL